LQYLWC